MSPGFLVPHNGGTGYRVAEVPVCQESVQQVKVHQGVVVNLGDVLRPGPAVSNSLIRVLIK